MRCTTTALLAGLRIYIGIGIITFTIGMILGYQLLITYYTKRLMVLAKEDSDIDSVISIVDELERETLGPGV